MKILIALSLALSAFAPSAFADYTCIATGFGGGQGGNHVEWGHGRTQKEAQADALTSCTRSTGYSCSLGQCFVNSLVSILTR